MLYVLAPLFENLRGNHRLDLPLWVMLPVCMASSVLLAALIYARVERPGIAFGKRWAGTFLPVKRGGTVPSDE